MGAGHGGLWSSLGLPSPKPYVDWSREIVVHFGAVHSGSCDDIYLLGVSGLRLADVISADSTVRATYGYFGAVDVCNADANPRAYIVAPERDLHPPVPFTVNVSQACVLCTEWQVVVTPMSATLS